MAELVYRLLVKVPTEVTSDLPCAIDNAESIYR